MNSIPPIASLLLATVLVAGCGEAGPAKYKVTGTVSHQGKPLPMGAVMFVPVDGPAGSAKIEPDGSYSVELVPGKHRVQVMSMEPRQGKPDPSKEGGLDTTGFPDPKSYVPTKYNHFETSGIEIEVKEDENVIPIELP